jgi:hypothetical protein
LGFSRVCSFDAEAFSRDALNSPAAIGFICKRDVDAAIDDRPFPQDYSPETLVLYRMRAV